MPQLTDETPNPWKLYRILVMPADAWDGQPWRALPAPLRWRVDGGQYGYRVRRWKRAVFPDLGQAVFTYHAGVIDGVEVDPPMDLQGWQVRIQEATAVRAPAPTDWRPAWRTVWLGEVKSQPDVGYAASEEVAGDRSYICEELLGATKRWPMDSHGFSFGMPSGVPCVGHPGYNLRPQSGDLLGNQDSDGYTPAAGLVPGFESDYHCHTWPGKGILWTDQQAVQNALLCHRPQGGPVIECLAVARLGGSDAWQIDPGDQVWDFLARILRRQRGRGLCFLGWYESDGEAPLALTLRVRAQVRDAITPPFGLDPIPGAEAEGTVRDVELRGDPRVVDGGTTVQEADQWRVDWLETIGDRLEVAATLGVLPDGTLDNRWTPAQVASHLAASPEERSDPRFENVYQLFGLRPEWDGTIGDGDGPGAQSLPSCDADGALVEGSAQELGINPAMIEVLPDLPVLTPSHGLTPPTRRKPLVLMRVSAGMWLNGEKHLGMSLHVRPDGILLAHPDNDVDGSRYVGDTTVDSLGSAWDYTAAYVTVALRLPARIRFASGNPNGLRRLRLEREHLGLWLVHNDAIIGTEGGGSIEDGFAPTRGSTVEGVTAGSYRVTRDDRDKLASLHALAWTWYGAARMTGTWQIRDTPATEAYDLGDLVGAFGYQGGSVVMDTPITTVAYDNDTGVATYETAWSGLDLDRA